MYINKPSYFPLFAYLNILSNEVAPGQLGHHSTKLYVTIALKSYAYMLEWSIKKPYVYVNNGKSMMYVITN